MDIDIHKLIPHRDRMKLIDAVVSAAEDAAVASAVVTDRWPLFDGEGVGSLVLIELAAQTSAVSIGWKKLMAGDESGGKGWLVGIRTANFFWETIPVGAEILTRSEIGFSLDNYTEIRATATVDGETVGEIGLQVLREETG
jgi:predicted hotdog family 3-hydroxylacyl-ACP dehydratase